MAAGCNSFGNGKLVQELRNENERLLAEFRAERERREQSERTAKLMERRLAESEKMLARQYQSPQAERLSRLHAPFVPGSAGNGGFAQPPFSSELQGTTGNQEPSADPGTGLRWQRRVTP